MAAPLTPRVDALEAKLDSIVEMLTLISRSSAPAKAAPAAKAEAKSPFIEMLAERREAKLTAGTHRPCPNCQKLVSVARTIELCKDCFHSTPAQRKARARKAR